MDYLKILNHKRVMAVFQVSSAPSHGAYFSSVALDFVCVSLLQKIVLIHVEAM